METLTQYVKTKNIFIHIYEYMYIDIYKFLGNKIINSQT